MKATPAFKATQSFEAVHSHDRFRLTATAVESGMGFQHVRLQVEDTDSGAAIQLARKELIPLFRAIAVALKPVEDAVAGLPSDPVERASRRVPHLGLPTALQRAHILKAYRQEMADIRERYVQRFDECAERARNPLPYTPPPPGPGDKWDPNS
jgi:hypothetical protein